MCQEKRFLHVGGELLEITGELNVEGKTYFATGSIVTRQLFLKSEHEGNVITEKEVLRERNGLQTQQA